jgi:membrane associated rhomboid family serine protease
MIYDRPYMRSDSGRREVSALAWIIGITIIVFVVQTIFRVWFKSPLIEDLFALSQGSMKNGFVWSLVTYGFLHGGSLHVLVNLLAAFILGRELLPILGPARFVGLYMGAIIVGGLTWLAVSFTHNGGILLGGSGAVFALLTVFACFYPNKPITFLLFFIIPVTVKPKYLALIFLGIAMFGLLFQELPGNDYVAHSAHLGGMLAGWIYFRYFHHRTGEFSTARPNIKVPQWFRRNTASPTPNRYKVNVGRPENVRAEVDRILDKINNSGFGSLTDREKKILDEAHDTLNRR